MDFNDIEKYYYSSNIKCILNFYYKIRSFDEIMNFIHNIPDPEIGIEIEHENADNEIVMVVPSPDVNDTYSTNLIKNFSKFKIIFSVSKGKYFNFSKSMNVGINTALKYNPKWIILSNVDVEPISNFDNIARQLNNINADIIIPRMVDENQKVHNITFLNKTGNFTNNLFHLFSPLNTFLPVYSRGQFILSNIPMTKNEQFIRFIQTTYKFNNYNGNLDLNDIQYNFISKYIYKKSLYYVNIQPFSIIKSSVLKDNKFDEDFINGGEDTELAIRLLRKHYKFALIDVSVKRYTGTYLGVNETRLLRNSLMSLLLLGKKLKESDFIRHE